MQTKEQKKPQSKIISQVHAAYKLGRSLKRKGLKREDNPFIRPLIDKQVSRFLKIAFYRGYDSKVV